MRRHLLLGAFGFAGDFSSELLLEPDELLLDPEELLLEDEEFPVPELESVEEKFHK